MATIAASRTLVEVDEEGSKVGSRGSGKNSRNAETRRRRGRKAEGRRNRPSSPIPHPLSLILIPHPSSIPSFPSPWLLLLEVLLSHLAQEYRGVVANNLQLPADSIERMEQLESAQTTIARNLPNCQQPSDVVQLLKPFDVTLLVLVAIRSERSLRKTIWKYLTHWSLIKPPLDGNDLKALGYKPGPNFRVILDTLFAVTVDGTIQNQTEAKAFLEKTSHWSRFNQGVFVQGFLRCEETRVE